MGGCTRGLMRPNCWLSLSHDSPFSWSRCTILSVCWNNPKTTYFKYKRAGHIRDHLRINQWTCTKNCTKAIQTNLDLFWKIEALVRLKRKRCKYIRFNVLLLLKGSAHIIHLIKCVVWFFRGFLLIVNNENTLCLPMCPGSFSQKKSKSFSL